MKTAEEYLKIWQGEELLITKDIAIIAMKEYGRQCAVQALKDAADRAEVEGTHNEGTIGYCVDRDSILLTPIVTP